MPYIFVMFHIKQNQLVLITQVISWTRENMWKLLWLHHSQINTFVRYSS